jgi:hypothetical protein
MAKRIAGTVAAVAVAIAMNTTVAQAPRADGSTAAGYRPTAE